MYYVIVNPASKSGQGKNIWTQCERVFIERRIPYRVILSKGIGHVTEVVRKLTVSVKEPQDGETIRLLLLGGDGTFNEALQGVRDFNRIWFGYIPTGSSNDLARALGLPKNPLDTLDTILSGKMVRTMDLGVLHYNDKTSSPQMGEDLPGHLRYFAVSCGIGFDAAVCQESLHSPLKRVLNKCRTGKLIYLIIALKQLFSSKFVNSEIFFDGNPLSRPVKDLFFATFMIHRYEGGGFDFCPTADCNDGLLDLCVIGKLNKLLLLLALPTAFAGRHYMFRGVDHYRAASFSLKCETPLWFHTDGESYVKSDSIRIDCRHNKIKLMM